MKLPRTLLGEAATLAVLVLIVALIANALHPKGLNLGKDYFPHDSSTNLQHDFDVLSFEDTKDWYPYAKDEDGGVVFLDARSEKDYVAGHIPGARLCHHYHQDLYVPEILDLLKGADMIVIYCAGGQCEDSIQLATDLVYRHGVPKAALAIFEGGYEQWIDDGMEIQKGDQP